jgi:tetratricopeptide (TPR) repeat protein
MGLFDFLMNKESDKPDKNDFKLFKSFTNKWMNEMNMIEKISIAGKTDKLHNQGIELLNKNYVDEALIYFIEALKVMPNNDDALRNLLICYRRKNDIEKLQETQDKLDYLTYGGAHQTAAKPQGISSNKSILEGASFSGARFNSSFYAESIDKAKEMGYAYANACFNYDENTVIAHGVYGNESPRDFINNNQYETFIIDITKKPLIINDMTVFYCISLQELVK